MKRNAVVIGRLLLMGLLIVIRWVFTLPFFMFLVLYTVCESTVNGITNLITYFQKLNDALFAETK
jgi:hypothetical protein